MEKNVSVRIIRNGIDFTVDINVSRTYQVKNMIHALALGMREALECVLDEHDVNVCLLLISSLGPQTFADPKSMIDAVLKQQQNV